MKRLAKERRPSARGYTMVEVMMGLAILAVGASAIVALQRFAVLGTMTSRHITNATNVSAGILEKMDTESGMWTDDGTSITTGVGTGVSGDPANLAETMPWLGPALQQALTDPTVWTAPDFRGFLIDGTVVSVAASAPDDPVAYCTHVRARFIGNPAASGPDNMDTADSVRVEVRTFFSKAGKNVAAECKDWSPAQVTALFDGTGLNTSTPNIPHVREEYGAIYLATILRRTTP